MRRVPEVSQCDIDGNPARPGAELAVGIEAGMGAVDAVEGVDSQVFRCGRVPNEAKDPMVDIRLVLPEERLKGFDVVKTELAEQVHACLLPI